MALSIDLRCSIQYKVARYDRQACVYALADCNETLSLHRNANPDYVEKLQFEADCIRYRIKQLEGSFTMRQMGKSFCLANKGTVFLTNWTIDTNDANEIYIRHNATGQWMKITRHESP